MMKMAIQRGIKAEDLYELKSVNDPQMSPDGTQYVFVETYICKEKHDYVSHLFVGNTDGGGVRQWTFGDSRDSSPRWSPDGKSIAFASNRSGKSQLYTISVDGGEPKQVTFCLNGARNPIWSPDSRKILFATSLAHDEKITDTKEKKEEKHKNVHEPMVVERLHYKSDDVGFVDNKNKHLAMLDLSTGELELVTEGNFDHGAGCFSPDGQYITFTADLSEEADYNLISDVYILNLATKEKVKVTESNGNFGNVSWSPDGSYLAFTGNQKEFKGATLSRLWTYSIETKELKSLTGEWDVYIGDVSIGDFQQSGSSTGILWTEDSRGFYFQMSDQGNTGVYYGSLEGEMYPVLFENQHVYGLTIDPKNHRGVVAISKPTHPSDLYSINFKDGEIKQLTSVNEEFLKEVQLSDAEPISFKAADGWEIQGWIMKPANFEEGKKYPTILEIHGGPHAMYANTYFHEFQTLTAKGFAVLFTNPRGSHGYGQKFVDAVRGDYGGSDYTDLMSAVDYAIETFDFIDETKLGVTGGSYGGFMTNWIVGHTDRFKAAVTQRSISNWISFYGVSDIGYFFTDWEVGAELDNIEKLWHHSPLKYVDNIKTPLLILHGERDFRCPIEQGEQLYVALKHQKKETKFVRFPGANHELSRSGNPSLRIHRLNQIGGWFEEYLLNR